MKQTTPVQSTASSTSSKPNWNPDWNSNAAQLKQQARIAQVSSPNNKDPLQAKDPLDRQAGVYAKALRIVNSPSFQKGNAKLKDNVLNTYYNNYVIPAYHWANVAAPDPEIWKKGVQSGKMSVNDFYLNRGHQVDAGSDFKAAFLNMGATASRFLGNFVNGAIVAGVHADEHVFGLKPYFNAPSSELQTQSERGDKRATLALVEKHAIPKGLMKMNQTAIDDANFWFEMRPSKTFQEAAGSFIGENAAQLPLYEAVSALRLGVTASTANKILSSATKPTVAASRTVMAANFTRRLAASSTGRFIGRRLGEAADAYIAGTVQNQPEDEKKAAVMSFIGLGVIGEGLGASLGAGVKLVSKTTMKAQIAHDAAIGGIPFVKAVADQADHEMFNSIIGENANGHPVRLEHKGEGKYTVTTPFSEFNIDGHARAMDFAFGMVDEGHANDPIKSKIVTAAKVSLSSLAKEIHGPDTLWRNLSKNQRNSVRMEFASRAAEAIEELPVHVPEVAAHEAQASIKASVADSPQLAKTFAAINELGKDLGISVEKAVPANEIETVKNTSGLKSVQGATYKAANVTRDFHQEVKNPVKREDAIFNELRHTGNLRYNSGDQAYNVKFASRVDKVLYNLNAKMTANPVQSRTRMVNQAEDLKRLRSYFPGKSDQEIYAMAQDVKAQLDAEIKDRRPKYGNDPETESNVLFPAKYEELATAAQDPEPRHYVSFKVDALAPMRNNFTKAASKSGQSLEKYLSGMDDADFVEEVKDHTGHAIHFEKPSDLMLWAHSNGDDLPKPIQNKIVEWLTNEDPTQNAASLRKQADILDHHIELLAYSGRLDSEGNVFRSTVTSAWKDRTKWQKQLLAEVSKEEISEYSRTMASFKKNWPQEYNDGLAMLTKLQTLRNKAKTLEGVMEHTDKARDIITKKPKGNS